MRKYLLTFLKEIGILISVLVIAEGLTFLLLWAKS